MGFYRFIKISGREGKLTGYFVPRMYCFRLNSTALKIFGLRYAKEYLKGTRIWWVSNKEDYHRAIETLEELKKTRIFTYKVLKELREEG